MKSIGYILGIFCMAGVLFSTSASAQAIVDHDSQYYLTLGTDVNLPSIYNLHVITPSGNVLYNLEWQLTEGNPFIPENGTNKLYLEQWLEGVWVYGMVTINSNGKCKIVLHGQIE